MFDKIVCSIYDAKAKAHRFTIVVRHIGEAVRVFTDIVNDAGTDMNKHPEDFILYKIAKWDEIEGKYENERTLETVCMAIDVKKNYPNHITPQSMPVEVAKEK